MSAPVLVEASRLFDGEAVQTDGRLLIEDGRIHSVGSSVAAPDGVERVQFGDATILPGLMDAHVHLGFDAGSDIVERLAQLEDDEVLQKMAQAATHALNAGVTTVRDLGARGDLIFRLRRLIEAGTVAGPHVLAAGRPLTIPDGHCYFLGGVAENEAELLGLVRTEVERGADVIKIMATGGAMTPSSDPTRPQFERSTLARAVDLAHSLGRPVAAHAHSREGMQDAVAAGVDTIEHGTFLGADGARVHDDDLALFPDSGTVLVATLAPVAARRQVPGADGGPIARELSAAEIWERRRADVGRLHAAGARVIAGSDCGVSNVPHDAVIDEIACLGAAGLSAVQALAAATSSAADALGIGATAGRLAPGLRADVLVIAGDPLLDIGALRRRMAVYKAGRRVI
jgi:imidazolonepropionase-like amidohydrolase